MIVTEDVVHVDALGGKELRPLHVSDRELEVLVGTSVDDERLTGGLERAEHAHERLGLDGGQLELLAIRCPRLIKLQFLY